MLGGLAGGLAGLSTAAIFGAEDNAAVLVPTTIGIGVGRSIAQW